MRDEIEGGFTYLHTLHQKIEKPYAAAAFEQLTDAHKKHVLDAEYAVLCARQMKLMIEDPATLIALSAQDEAVTDEQQRSFALGIPAVSVRMLASAYADSTLASDPTSADKMAKLFGRNAQQILTRGRGR